MEISDVFFCKEAVFVLLQLLTKVLKLFVVYAKVSDVASYLIVSLDVSIFGIIGFLVLMPVRYSYETAFLNVVRDKDVKDLTTRMFSCFNTKEYGRAIEMPLLVSVYTFLWMLLFIIPGIVKAYSYAMAIYISKDKPELSAEECIQESRRMMSGHKGELFLLDLSYIGWGILCILTCGILSLWVAPKMQTAHVLFYEDLKAEESARTEQ